MEESRGPTDFGEEEDDDLPDDQKTVEDGPEDASWLVGNGRFAIEIALARTRVDTEADVRDVIILVIRGRRVVRRERGCGIRIVLEGVESLDVLDEGQDAARED